MDAEFDTAPIAKKAKGEDTIDIDKCLFCTKSFSSKEQPVTPVLNKLRSLFSACRQRNDSVSQKLLAHESDIISGTVVFRYHRQCRSTYVSQHHIRRAIKTVDNSDVVLDDGGNSSSGNGDGASGGCANRFTRSKASVVKFDWKSRCFICSDPCSSKHRLSWSMVESSVKDDPEHPNMYTRVLQAAKAKQDDDMITRLQGVPNGDLVAIEARYHRQKSCYINYVSGRSITASKNRKQQFAAHSTSVRRLISEFTSPIIEHRQIFFLSTLRKRFLEILAEEGVDHPGSYTSYNLKRQLIKEWPDVAFMPQPGKSDLVCSSKTTVGDALQKAYEMSKVLREVAEDEETSLKTDLTSSMVDESIGHQAMGILRRGFYQIHKLDDEYYSSAEMSTEAKQEFVDPLLYTALGWLTDENMHAEAIDIADTEPTHSKCLNIACDIITLATSVASPKHLGLAAHLHHHYGSRQLVDDMYHMGYSVSYTEIRQFETSAANHVCNQQIPTACGAYIPPEITPRDRGGQLIVAVADNWDHNERTTYGKRTTHAMTSILVQRSTERIHTESPRIQRAPGRTFNTTDVPGI